MTDLGEWGHLDPPALNGSDALGRRVGTMAAAMVEEVLADQVRMTVRKQLAVVVQAAVADTFTPDRLAELQEQADLAAEAELGDTSDADESSQLYYGSVDEFVREMIVPVFRRRVGERAARRWAAEWWRSAEAIIRLEALWRSWEHLRLDPATGMSVWLRDHADHHIAALMDPDGAFATSRDENRPGEPLPYTPPPDGLFPDVRRSE